MLLSCRKVIVCFIFSSKWNKNFFNLAFSWNFDNCIRGFFSINSNLFGNITSLWINIVGPCRSYIAILSVNCNRIFTTVFCFIFFITNSRTWNFLGYYLRFSRYFYNNIPIVSVIILYSLFFISSIISDILNPISSMSKTCIQIPPKNKVSPIIAEPKIFPSLRIA